MTNALDTPYNHVRQKSVHNTFQRDESIADQFLYWRIRSMEIDVHHSDPFGTSTPGDWSVHHDWYDPISSIANLSEFLRTMRGLHRTLPKHEVTTLFIDIKDPFPRSASARHGWKAFDALIDEHLGPLLYRPKDLLHRGRNAKTLRESLAMKGWPTLGELRGKFIVVLTGSPLQLADYAQSARAALNRSAFLSAPVDAASHIPGRGDEIFFNISGEKNMHLIKKVHPLGYVARAYYLNSEELCRAAHDANCHHLATDKVNEEIDPWSTTRNANGFPFQRLDGSHFDATEAGEVCGIWARSNDMWADRDSFQFHYRRTTPAKSNRMYQFAISGPNGRTEPFTKGAVLARSGLEPDAPYFGVFRVGQQHGLRVQFRAKAGGPTKHLSRPIGPVGMFGHHLDQDTIVHVRLKVDQNGRRARAWGSYDRSQWVLLGAYTFALPLRYQGIGVSSHDQAGGTKFLFIPAQQTKKATELFDQQELVGGRKDHDGWVDWDGTGRWRTSRHAGWRPRKKAKGA